MGFLQGNRSNFPTELDQIREIFDLTPALKTSAVRWQELKMKTTLTPSELTELNNLTALLQDYLMTPELFNKFGDVVIQLQKFFRDNVEGYITTKQGEMETFVSDAQTAINTHVNNKQIEMDNYSDAVKLAIEIFAQELENNFTDYVDFQATYLDNKIENFTDRGDFELTTQYYQHNVVSYNHEGETQAYLCTKDSIGNLPLNAEFFRKLTMKGDTGTGLSFSGAWNESSTYNLNDSVSYGGFIFASISNNNTGNVPDLFADTGYWAKALGYSILVNTSKAVEWLDSSTNSLPIKFGDITVFNKTTDVLDVYMNSIRLTENVHYTVDGFGENIIKTTGNWEGTVESPILFEFVVKRQAVGNIPLISGGDLQDGSVNFTKLDGNTRKKIVENGIYQLQTTGKNAYAATLSGLTLFEDLKVLVYIDQTNDASPSLNINGLGAVDLTYMDEGVKTVLEEGKLEGGHYYLFVYDGFDFVLFGGVGGGGGGKFFQLPFTLTTAWTGTQAPYTQTIFLNGVKSNMAFTTNLDLSNVLDYNDQMEVLNQWSKVYRMVVSGDNEITAYASDPTVSNVDVILQTNLIEGTIETITRTTTIPVDVETSWAGSEAPYSQVISVSGLIPNMPIIVNLDLSSLPTYSDQMEVLGQWSKVFRVFISGTDEITVLSSEPTTRVIRIVLNTVDLGDPVSEVWGNLGGSIDNQIDLKNKLDEKEKLSNKTETLVDSHVSYPSSKAVKDAVDAKASSNMFKITIGDNWVGSGIPYTQNIVVEGVLETDYPIIDVDLSEAVDYGEENGIVSRWIQVYRVETYNGGIVVYSNQDTVGDIPIMLKVVR